MITYQPDRVSNVTEIIFGISSPERIQSISCCEVYRHITGNNKDQPGTQSDSRLGVIDRGKVCQTCLNDYRDCPGHMGHIKLAKPVFHPLYLPVVMKILLMVCPRCSRLLVDFTRPETKAEISRIMSKIPKARFPYAKNLVDIEKKLSTVRTSVTEEDKKRKEVNVKCCHCKANLPSKIKKHPNFLSKLVLTYESGSGSSKRPSDRFLNPEIVLSILKGLPDEDISLMGFDPKLSRPEWMIWTVMPFPPITVRPPTKLDVGRYGDDDLTIKLNDISKTNNNIKIQLQKIAEEKKVDPKTYSEIEYLWEILQLHITCYIDNESSKNSKTAVHRSGRPLKALVQRIKAKEGRVRWNLMGKRVNDSGRTVITPDNNINLDEIGIPLKIAVNLVKPEVVTVYNIDRLQMAVYNGLDAYPGAKYVVSKGSRFKKPLKIMNAQKRRQIKIAVGDTVYRNLMDGDWVLVNRQPSLHRMSMMAHRIVIVKGETFRLNVQSTPPYNADFDGDEMNIHVPQSIEAENELERLSHLATQIVSPKNSLPVMGLIQDSLLGLYMFTQFGFLSVKNSMKMLNDLDLSGNVINYEVQPSTRGRPTGGPTPANCLMAPSWNIINEALPKITVINANPKKKGPEHDVVKYGRLGQERSIGSELLKAGRTGLFHVAWSDYGPKVSKNLFDSLARIATDWLLISGFSIGILDCIPFPYIKDRINSIVSVYDLATQYLVDYQQLKELATFDIGDSGFQAINNLRTLINNENYTYSNKNVVEGRLAEIYFPLIVNRLLYEMRRLEDKRVTFPPNHRDRMINKNIELIFDLWVDPDKGYICNVVNKFEMGPELKDRYAQLVRELSGKRYTGDSVDNINRIRGILEIHADHDLIGHGETLLQQMEAFCAFVQTLIHIVPGSPDISDRLEEKLYELTQNSTNIVNAIISENIGFYEYNGSDRFEYIGNAFKTMYLAKSKGDTTNIGQIAGLLGQQDLEGKRQGNFFYRRSLPHYPKDSIDPKSRGYVQNSFLDGLMMLEYFSHAQAGRLNQIDKTIKSVTADTRILVLEDGKVLQVTIGEWIDAKLARHPNLVERHEEQNMELLKLHNRCYIPTADENGNVTWGKIKAVTRHDPGLQLYEIKTAGGRSVIVTESKSLLIWNRNVEKFLHTSTPDVVVGDCVPVTTKLADPPFTKLRINMSDYVSGLDSDQVFALDYKNGLFLGLFLAEGDAEIESGYVRITTDGTAVSDFVKGYFGQLGMEIEEVDVDGRTLVRGRSHALAGFLAGFVGLGRGTKTARVPGECFVSPADFIRGILRGYVSSHGTITGDSIEIGSSSASLIDGMSMLCTRLGIFGEIHKVVGPVDGESIYSRLYIGHRWAVLFAEEVGLIDPNEDARLKNMWGSTCLDGFLVQNDVMLDRIVEISKIDVAKYPKVYDLTVPSTVNFGLANGLHVVDTAETGYLQRKLIKMMEGLVVQYDGTVRNSSKNVIQKLYGGDAVDPQQLENVLLDFSNIRQYHFTARKLEELKGHLTDGVIMEMDRDAMYLSKINEQYRQIKADLLALQDFYPHLEIIDAETAQFLAMAKEDGKDDDVESVIKSCRKSEASQIYAFLPVNFERLVRNNYYRFQLDRSTGDRGAVKTDLSPSYVADRLSKLLDHMRSFIILNSRDHLLLFSYSLNTQLSINRLIVTFRYTQRAFDALIEDIYLKYCRSLIAPGESIGIISAQSIGEPLTQMTLNKFHAAGVGKARSKLQGGVPRLAELLGLTRGEKMKTSSMTMKVSEYHRELNEQMFKGEAGNKYNPDINIINQIKVFEFKKMVRQCEICYDPKAEKPPADINFTIMDNVSVADPKSFPWVVHFQLKFDKKRNLRSDAIYNMVDNALRSKYKSTYQDNSLIQVSYDGLLGGNKKSVNFVIVRCKSDLFKSDSKQEKASSAPNNILGDLIDLKNEIMKINVRGIGGVSDLFIEKEGGQKMVTTMNYYGWGSDPSAIIKNPILSQIIDVDQVTANDVLQIEELYGIEAARNCFIQEMYNTLSSDMNIRHLELLADNMSHLGELLSVNRFGVKRGNNEPLHRASFEETTKQFVDSSLHTEKDPMRGPSANVMFGQFINSGTNAFTIALDHEKLMQLEPIGMEEKVDVDPFNKKGVQMIELNDTTTYLITNLVIEDLFVFKFDPVLLTKVNA